MTARKIVPATTAMCQRLPRSAKIMATSMLLAKARNVYLTMAAAKTLARLNPEMVFTYVTGKGSDSTEQGQLRWARVKGKTENDLLRLPFRAAYMFRPNGIQPLHGVRSKTGWINAVYAVSAPLLSYLVRATPGIMTTSEKLGRAMIKVARDGYPKPILESEDINRF